LKWQNTEQNKSPLRRLILIMKAEFFFPDDPITGYGENDNKEQQLANEGIKSKVHNKPIELPCVPTKEMQVDISSFADLYGFTKEEMAWIEDCNQYHHITDIFMKVDRLEIWLQYTIDV
jgi:hypothetical protein